MKKPLLSIVAVCALISAGGYNLAVSRFAAEAQAFKENLQASNCFHVAGVEVNKYAFTVKVKDITFTPHLEGWLAGSLPEHLKDALSNSLGSWTLKGEYVVSYHPISKKLTITHPGSVQEMEWRALGQLVTLISKGDMGVTELTLNRTPMLQGVNVVQFFKDYVQDITMQGKKIDVFIKEAKTPLFTSESSQNSLSVTTDAGIRTLQLSSDIKGSVFNPEELMRLLLPMVHSLVAQQIKIFEKGAPAEVEEEVTQAVDREMEKLAALSQAGSALYRAKHDRLVDLKVQADFPRLLEMFLSKISQTNSSKTQPKNIDVWSGIKGSAFELKSTDRFLGSSQDLLISFKTPQLNQEGEAEFHYRGSGYVSKELQEFLPEVFRDKMNTLSPEATLTLEAVKVGMPDFASMGELVFDLRGQCDVDKVLAGQLQGKVNLEMSCLPYSIKAAIQIGETNAVVRVDLVNHEGMLADLQAYLNKVSENPSTRFLVPAGLKQNLYTYIDLAKANLTSLGREEDVGGKKSLVIEQTIPLALVGLLTGSSPEKGKAATEVGE